MKLNILAIKKSLGSALKSALGFIAWLILEQVKLFSLIVLVTISSLPVSAFLFMVIGMFIQGITFFQVWMVLSAVSVTISHLKG